MRDGRVTEYAFLIGMPRAATTYLYHSLSSHPNVCVPYKRKTNFFSLHLERGASWFHRNFKPATNEFIGIDTETLSFIDFGLDGHVNIASTYQHSKAVLIVRDPEEWVVSLYKQIRTFDNRIDDFENFVNGGYVLIEDDKKVPFNYIDGSLGTKIKEIQELFSGRLLIVDFRMLALDPVRFIKEIETFLELDDYFNDENVIQKKINSSDRKGSKLMNILMRSTMFTKLVRILVPAKLILMIRKKLDQLFSEVTASNEEAEDFVFVKGRFPQDTQFVKKLFVKKEFIKC